MAPEEPVIEAVLGAVRSSGLGEPASVSRLPQGMSNAVFEVGLGDGRRVVARASLSGTKRYSLEQGLMERVRSAGVPCPEVCAVVAGEGYDVMLLEHVAGARLSELPEAASMAAACGEVLAAVHEVAVAGFGNIEPTGRGVSDSLEQWFVDDFEPRFRAASAVVDSDARAVIEQIWSELDAARPLLRQSAGSLAHGDFSPANLLVDRGRVAGLVDWESAKAGPPGFDFGWWDWCSDAFGTPFATDELVRQYARHRALDLEETSAVRRLVVLRVLVGHVAWAAEREDKTYLAPSVARLRSAAA